MKDIKFAVIGAGPGGLSMAAHLAILGYHVNLFNRSKKRIASIQKQKSIKAYGAVEGIGKLKKVTTDIHEALEDVNMIFVVVPAYAHKDIAELCASHAKDGQIFLLNPGRTFGAMAFSTVMKKNGLDADIVIAESHTIPHTCRNIDGDDLQIFAVKTNVRIAAFPSCKIKEVLDILNDILSIFIPAKDIFETGLNNIGSIFHPAPTLLNMGWIETKKFKFKYYYDGITSSVAKILEQLDEERVMVAKALQTKVITSLEWLYEAYGSSGDTIYKALQKTECYKAIEAPVSLRHRYLFEDVPTGLVPIASLARKVGIDTPVMNLIIDLACLACGVNFREIGRTMSSLGLDHMTIDEIKAAIEG